MHLERSPAGELPVIDCIRVHAKLEGVTAVPVPRWGQSTGEPLDSIDFAFRLEEIVSRTSFRTDRIRLLTERAIVETHLVHGESGFQNPAAGKIGDVLNIDKIESLLPVAARLHWVKGRKSEMPRILEIEKEAAGNDIGVCQVELQSRQITAKPVAVRVRRGREGIHNIQI